MLIFYLLSRTIIAGHLSSKPGQIDKRNVNISITDKGLSVMQKNTLNSNKYFLDILYNFTRTEIKSFRKSLEKLSDYNHINQKHFEKQVKIDIGKDLKDMEKFLEQIRKFFL